MDSNEVKEITQALKSCSLAFPQAKSGRDGKELLLKDAYEVYQIGENELNADFWPEFKEVYLAKLKEAQEYCSGEVASTSTNKSSTKTKAKTKANQEDKARRLKLARVKAKALKLKLSLLEL